MINIFNVVTRAGCQRGVDAKPANIPVPKDVHSTRFSIEDEDHTGDGSRAEKISDEFVPLTVRIPAAVRMTGIGRSKLYELIASGDIEIVKIGSSTLIPVAGLQALIDRYKQ
jgi:excisionase family DNA binding protein